MLLALSWMVTGNSNKPQNLTGVTVEYFMFLQPQFSQQAQLFNSSQNAGPEVL